MKGMDMSVMILDAGNSIIKAKIAQREGGEIAFPHALQPLTESEYSAVLSRAGKKNPPPDYVRVNGQPYVVGESAERHGVITQRNGAARYNQEYYGVFAAVALARLYSHSREVMIFGSHPPSDVKFRKDSLESLIGGWTIEIVGTEKTLRIVYANTFG